MNKLLKGVITGAVIMLVLVLVIAVFRFFGERDKKIYEYMEAQRELQVLQEDINNRSFDDFLEEPGIRGAANTAVDEFQRKRDEALQRFRNRRAD
jgi:transposase-like protein